MIYQYLSTYQRINIINRSQDVNIVPLPAGLAEPPQADGRGVTTWTLHHCVSRCELGATIARCHYS